jgi:hypothetical protein
MQSPMIRMKIEMIGQPQAIAAEAERGEAARQDRDDRERDGEVTEAGPGPVEFLGVAERCKVLLVVVEQFVTLWHGNLLPGAALTESAH